MGEDEGSLAVILGGLELDDDDDVEFEPKIENPSMKRQEEARRAAEGAAARRLRRAMGADGSERELMEALKDAVRIVTKKKG